MSGYAIEMNSVAKRYGKRCILDSFDLAVPKGAVYALLGNNGAGKSTSIRLMTGQLLADSGKISVLGLDPVKEAVALRLRLGYGAAFRLPYSAGTFRIPEAFLPGLERSAGNGASASVPASRRQENRLVFPRHVCEDRSDYGDGAETGARDSRRSGARTGYRQPLGFHDTAHRIHSGV